MALNLPQHTDSFLQAARPKIDLKDTIDNLWALLDGEVEDTREQIVSTVADLETIYTSLERDLWEFHPLRPEQVIYHDRELICTVLSDPQLQELDIIPSID